MLPLVELGLAAWLVSGLGARQAALALVAVLASLVGAQLALRRAGFEGGCGCFGANGTSPGELWAAELVRTAALLGVALAAFVLAPGRSGWFQPDPGVLAGQLTVALGLALTWHCGVALWRQAR